MGPGAGGGGAALFRSQRGHLFVKSAPKDLVKGWRSPLGVAFAATARYVGQEVVVVTRMKKGCVGEEVLYGRGFAYKFGYAAL